MKAGVIGTVESESQDLTEFNNSVKVGDEQFEELNQCLRITEDVRLPDGRTAQFGQAAIEEPDSEETTRIEENEINTYTKPIKSVTSTHFLHVPGSFVAASSGSGRFVFELISSNTEITINRLEFDIDSYVESAYSDGINPWKVGFYDCLGNTDNGVVHGESLLSDSDFEETFKSSRKNQIGLEYQFNDKMIRNFVTESGYAEIYQPSDYSTGEFAKFVEEELLEHGYKP